jgi:hypothetical protein
MKKQLFGTKFFIFFEDIFEADDWQSIDDHSISPIINCMKVIVTPFGADVCKKFQEGHQA